MIKNTFLIIALVLIVSIGLFYFWTGYSYAPEITPVIEPQPNTMTLSGTYTCLPFLDATKVPSADCIFGLKSDTGEYYMVNFGQSALAMKEFKKGAHIVAEGFFMSKESLSTNQWKPYTMKGIFTVTKKIIAEEPVVTSTPTKLQPTPIICSKEAKICPDGSSVFRTGSKCEFATCLEVIQPTMICDYAAPPAHCNYVAGPNYNAQTMCGMVLKCSSSTEAI